MREMYFIELQRTKRTGYVNVAIFSGLGTFLCGLNMLGNRADPITQRLDDFQYLNITMMLVLGIVTSVLLVTSLGSDVSSGVFSSYLSYPTRPRTVVVAKWLAKYSFWVPSTVIPFLLLSPLVPYLSLNDWFFTIATILVMFAVIFVISLLCSAFIGFRPLPEVVVIVYVLILSVFETALALPKPLLYALDPTLFLRTIYLERGAANENPYFGVLSIVFYGALFLLSLFLYDRREWGKGDGS